MKYALPLALCSLLFAISAGAVGVAVYPAEITVTAQTDAETTTRIKVSNPSSDVAVFEIYPDEFDQFIKISPSSFTLESKEERQITITITPREIGQLHTTLSVIGRPMASNSFQAGSGVKIPLTITVGKNSNNLASALASIGTNQWAGAILLIVVAGWYGYRFKKRRSTSRDRRL